MKREVIVMDADNRMLRAGVGKDDGRWFARFDFWSIGYRFTSNDFDSKPKVIGDNRILRAGFGKHKGKRFLRFDFWVVGYRFTGDTIHLKK